MSFSPQAVELQGIVADALEQPEVRMELVQQARAELEKGLPGFDPDMLAAALLQDIFDIPMEDL